MSDSLYDRLGGYDGISGFANNLLPRLQSDAQLGRFWENRGEDGIAREKQLLIDFLCSCAGGELLYTGRDMKVTHRGMKISEGDWALFIEHIHSTLKDLGVSGQTFDDVISFASSLKAEIVEC
jgi:hemoglobin